MSEKVTLIAHLEQVRQAGYELLRTKVDGFARQLQEATSRLVADLDLLLPANPEIVFPLDEVEELLPKPAQPVQALDLTSVRNLDAGRAQSEVLQAFLQALEPFAGGRAILVFREGQALGWNGVGFSPEAVRSWRAAVEASPILAKVAEGTPVLCQANDDQVIAGFLRNPGVTVLLVPMSLRGKVVGVLLAEEGGNGLAVDWIQLFTYLVGLLLETLAVRTTVPTPSVAPVEDLRSSRAAEPEAEIAFTEEAPFVAAVPTVTPPEMVATGQERAEVSEEEPRAGAGVHVAAQVVEGEPGGAQPAVPPPSTLPGETPDVDASATQRLEVTPVVPPRSPEEEHKHQEAKRFARLLVSEIRLYNEQAVQEGKASKDLYARLKEDIDRSREMYEQRIPPEVRAVSDYFYEELVRILADGDPDVLGL